MISGRRRSARYIPYIPRLVSSLPGVYGSDGT